MNKAMQSAISCLMIMFSSAGFLGCAGETDDNQQEDVAGVAEQEIYYGTASGVNFGIVEITRNLNTNKPCTAYFISRRHLVTSAHCTDRFNTSQFYFVRVKTGYGTFATLRDTARTDNWVYMKQSIFPGWNYDSPNAAYDTAILTLPSTVVNVPPNSQLLRVSTAAPVVNQGQNIWGWGAYAFSAGGPMRPYDLLFGDNVYVSAVNAGWFTASSTGSRLTCLGDSGGPSTRYINGYYIATGTHRGSLDDPRCAWPNEQMLWSSTSNKTSWIEGVIRQTYGSAYSCARLGAGADAHMRCF
jgi:hypothetical protein